MACILIPYFILTLALIVGGAFAYYAGKKAGGETQDDRDLMSGGKIAMIAGAIFAVAYLLYFIVSRI